MYYNAKKLKPGLVASYNIWPGNGDCLFLFWSFINFSLLTYKLAVPDPHTATFCMQLLSVYMHYNVAS